MKTGLRGFRPDPTKPQKMTRGLKIRIKEVEGLYYLCNKNKGADQLRGEADLRLCFRICKKPVFSRRGSFYSCENCSIFVTVDNVKFISIATGGLGNPVSVSGHTTREVQEQTRSRGDNLLFIFIVPGSLGNTVSISGHTTREILHNMEET